MFDVLKNHAQFGNLSDFLGHPSFSPDAEPQEIAEFIAHYHTDREYKCSVCKQHQNHKHGFCFVTQSGAYGLIGQDCAKRHMGVDFHLMKNDFLGRHNRSTANEMLSANRPAVLQAGRQAEHLMQKANQYASQIASFKRSLRPASAERLMQRSKRRNGHITKQIRHQGRLLEIVKATGGAEFEEAVEYLILGITGPASIGSAKQRLKRVIDCAKKLAGEMERHTDRELSKLIKTANESTRLIQQAEQAIGECERFLAHPNLSQILRLQQRL